MLILRESAQRLELPEPLMLRTDAMRRIRHQIFYDVDEVTRSQLRDALKDADQIVRLAGEWLEDPR